MGEIPKFGDKNYSAAQRIQQMLVLNNKVNMQLRLLHSARQENAALTYKVKLGHS